jgi:hypothetical protein
VPQVERDKVSSRKWSNGVVEYWNNGLLKLVESLERKRATGEWTDHLLVKEGVKVYESG